MNYTSFDKKYIICIYLSISLIYFSSCDKEEYVDRSSANESNKEINTWVYKTMSDYYYWNHFSNDSILTYTSEPNIFFKTLLSPKDKFSWILDNKQDNLNILNGIRKNYGFEYVLGYKDQDKNNLFGLILYVHANNQVANEFISRGDYFDKINGQSLNNQNYQELLNLDNAVFNFYRISGDSLKSFSKKMHVNQYPINPILTTKIYNVENFHVGYICYNQFLADNGDKSEIYKKSLLREFKEFKDKNIEELVVDLRYNPGGLIDLSVLFASLIVPNIDSSRTALITDYNDKLYLYFKLKSIDPNIKFKYYPNSYVGENLRRVFFITGKSTASASEALINILLPYMEVIILGESTYGKNYGSAMFVDENKNNNWVLQPIVMKLFNSLRESNYENGFNPRYNINEFDYEFKELGDIEEPILNKVLSIITNKISIEKSTYNIEHRFTPLESTVSPEKINLANSVYYVNTFE